MQRERGSQARWLRSARFWVGIAAGVVAMYLAAGEVEPRALLGALSRTNLLYLALALASYLLTNWAKARRWRLLFYPRDSALRLRDCLSIVFVGQLANNVLPVRLGELARAYLIGEVGHVGKVFSFATTVVEKAFDSVMLLLLIALLAPFVQIPSWLARSSLLLSAALALLLVFLVVAVRQRGRLLSWLEALATRWPRLPLLPQLRRLLEASQELEALDRAEVHVRLWGWSGLIWALAAATNALTFRAIGLSVPPVAAPLLLIVLMAGGIVPSAPLQLGVFHYLCVLTLSLLGVAQDAALSYAILLHLVVYLPITVGGVLGLWWTNYDLAKVHALPQNRTKT